MSPRVAAVTGAARGIGSATARRLRRDGWAVVLVDKSAEVMETAADLDPSGEWAIGFRADVTVSDEVVELRELIRRSFGHVDAIVANVGIGGPSSSVIETSDSAVKQVMNVNVHGNIATVRALTPLLRREGQEGRIVFVGSLFAQQPVQGAGAYIISKQAIVGLTHSLALELAPSITVNAVSPGYIMTEMHLEELETRADRAGTTWEEQAELVRDAIPLGRHGEGEDVAAAISFLLSPDAAYITGQTISVNGGVYLT